MTSTTWDELTELYLKCPERSLDKDLMYFLKYGYIFTSPNYILIGQRVENGWHIHAAIGRNSLNVFAVLMPYYLPYIGWSREAHPNKKSFTWYRTETVFRRINMKLTSKQMMEKALFESTNIVREHRSEAPQGFDPVAFGGGVPKAPKPPAPPTPADAASSVLNQGKDRKRKGYASTVLTQTPNLTDKLGG